jgi:hypothetical protein
MRGMLDHIVIRALKIPSNECTRLVLPEGRGACQVEHN